MGGNNQFAPQQQGNKREMWNGNAAASPDAKLAPMGSGGGGGVANKFANRIGAGVGGQQETPIENKWAQNKLVGQVANQTQVSPVGANRPAFANREMDYDPSPSATGASRQPQAQAMNRPLNGASGAMPLSRPNAAQQQEFEQPNAAFNRDAGAPAAAAFQKFDRPPMQSAQQQQQHSQHPQQQQSPMGIAGRAQPPPRELNCKADQQTERRLDRVAVRK